MARDKLTFYPKAKYRDFWEDYPAFRYDYLFTELSQQELYEKYGFNDMARKMMMEFTRAIKEELGLPKSINRVDIHYKISNGSLKVDEWL